MAVENPDDVDGILAKAQANSEQRRGGDKEEGKGPDVTLKIEVFANGFRVDEGEFRPYETDENKKFLKELNEGYVPEEIRKIHNKPVGIDLVNRRKETFKPPPPPKYVSYSGEGVSMGGTTGVGGAVNKESTDGKPVVDDKEPKTTIQIRFHNGERGTLTLNLTHTVADIHAYVACAAPVDGEYSLVSGFPPKPLNDPSKTI